MNNDEFNWIRAALERIEARIERSDERDERRQSSLAHLESQGEAQDVRTSTLENELKPIKAHVQLVASGARIVSTAGAALATCAAIARALGKL